MPDATDLPQTAEALVAEAKRLRFEASVLAAQAGAKIAQAEAYEALAGVRSAVAESRLTIARESATNEPQMKVESAGAGRSRGQIDPAHLDHKFVEMLNRRGLTVRDVGDHLEKKLKRKFPNQTIQAWYRDESDLYFRAPPEDAVLVLKEDFAVPLSAWARVRKPKPARS